MPIFGITASSNMSIKLTDFYQIATTTVGSGGAANIEFTSIPQTYTHLQIRGILRTTTANTGSDNALVQFNSDTGSNYSWHLIQGSGSAASSAAGATQTSMRGAEIPRNNNTASAFGVLVLDILDYANTNKYKTIRSIDGWDGNGSGSLDLHSGNWRSTSAVTSIKFVPEINNFAQYSSLALYGVNA